MLAVAILLLSIMTVAVACGDDTTEGTETSMLTTSSESETATTGLETTVPADGTTTSGGNGTTTSGGDATTTPAAGGTTSSMPDTSSTTVGSATTVPEGMPTGPITIEVQLTGDAAVPPVDTAATGTFTIEIPAVSAESTSTTAMGTDSTTAGSTTGGEPGGSEITYKLDVTDIEDVTLAHIHQGAADANGPIVCTLFDGEEEGVKEGAFSGTLAEGTIDESMLEGPMEGQDLATLISAIMAGDTYVQVHTQANPAGEIRGQLIPTDGGTTTTSAPGTSATTSATDSTTTDSTIAY